MLPEEIKKNVVIRADAFQTSGSGHIIRCLSLAYYLVDKVSVFFICRSISDNLYDKILQMGCQVIIIPTNEKGRGYYYKKFSVTEIRDAIETIGAIKNLGRISCMIVDHYELTAIWEKRISKYVDKIFVMDDTADNQHFCQYLLHEDYTPLIEKKYKGLILNNCKLFLGPRYFLFRQEFFDIKIKEKAKVVRKILVTFGGSDPACATEIVVKAIKKLDDLAIKVYVVIGGGNIRYQDIIDLCINDKRFVCLKNIDYMAKLINEVDMVISAIGITAWECCFLETPMLGIATSYSQRVWAESLNDDSLYVYLGIVDDELEDKIIKYLRNIYYKKTTLNNVSYAKKKYLSHIDIETMVDVIIN